MPSAPTGCQAPEAVCGTDAAGGPRAGRALPVVASRTPWPKPHGPRVRLGPPGALCLVGGTPRLTAARASCAPDRARASRLTGRAPWRVLRGTPRPGPSGPCPGLVRGTPRPGPARVVS